MPRAWGPVGAPHPHGVPLIPGEMVREANNSPGDDLSGGAGGSPCHGGHGRARGEGRDDGVEPQELKAEIAGG